MVNQQQKLSIGMLTPFLFCSNFLSYDIHTIIQMRYHTHSLTYLQYIKSNIRAFLGFFFFFLFVSQMKTNIYSVTVNQFIYILLSFNIYEKRKKKNRLMIITTQKRKLQFQGKNNIKQKFILIYISILFHILCRLNYIYRLFDC